VARRVTRRKCLNTQLDRAAWLKHLFLPDG